MKKKTKKRFNFKLNNNTKIILIILLFFIITVVPSYYFYNKYKKVETQLNIQSQKNAEKEIKTIIDKLNEFIELPSEQPALATVSDVEKLNKQPFFKNAKNGDKVLIFRNAKKAILYRPSTGKIIEVSPITANKNPIEPTITTSPTPSTTITPTSTP